MARSKSTHVVPRGKGWAVKKSGNSKASVVTRTKAQAVQAGRSLSRSAKTEFVVHGKNGQIQTKNSHGNDPHPPKG